MSSWFFGMVGWNLAFLFRGCVKNCHPPLVVQTHWSANNGELPKKSKEKVLLVLHFQYHIVRPFKSLFFSCARIEFWDMSKTKCWKPFYALFGFIMLFPRSMNRWNRKLILRNVGMLVDEWQIVYKILQQRIRCALMLNCVVCGRRGHRGCRIEKTSPKPTKVLQTLNLRWHKKFSRFLRKTFIW